MSFVFVTKKVFFGLVALKSASAESEAFASEFAWPAMRNEPISPSGVGDRDAAL